jgi:hypothetical protein
MHTQCRRRELKFQPLGRRSVVAGFDAGRVSSDGGALLLGELDRRIGLVQRFAGCFSDYRDSRYVEHPVEDLLRQRVLGLCLGYEDLNDHDTLRGDALLATAVGKRDPTGQDRRREQDRGSALAGKSTLNRIELAAADADAESRYKKVVADDAAIERFFVDEFIDATGSRPPKRLVLDIDPSDIELHGAQEGRFYHGYYGHYCYLPLYIFCGQHLLMARVRKADIDGAAGTVEALEWLVPLLREQWPEVEIVLRADSGFARDQIFTWCEANDVEFVIGLARNAVLLRHICDELEEAREECAKTASAARVFSEFDYRTKQTWSRARRVVAKAESLPGKDNPRFVVTSYDAERFDPKTLYEQEYCARGEMENRLKEQQLDLFGDRTSCTSMRANQLRVWLASVAYLLMVEFRATALAGTELERAQTKTIRLRLLKVGALITISVRRVRIALSSVFPLQHVFTDALELIKCAYAPQT